MTQSSERKKYMQPFIHIIVWCIVFCLPLFFFENNFPVNKLTRYLDYVIAPLSFFVAFYLNYFYFTDRYLFRKQTQKYITANVILIVVLCIIIRLWKLHLMNEFIASQQSVASNHARPPQPWHSDLFFILRDAGSLILTIGLCVAIKMTFNWLKSENARKELEQRRTEAELQNLKNQLNPHFLFNTLNNIYSLIAFSPEKAQQAIHDLSTLLRYVLYDNSPNYVPLGKELEFVRNYVELMKLRLSDNVKVSLSIEGDPQGESIAPLLFISLIENAFKHGVSNNKNSFIDINIVIGANSQIICSIVNSYFPKDKINDKSGSGIGIENLKKRLELLYPDRYIFHTEQTDNKYSTILTLLIQKRDEP